MVNVVLFLFDERAKIGSRRIHTEPPKIIIHGIEECEYRVLKLGIE